MNSFWIGVGVGVLASAVVCVIVGAVLTWLDRRAVRASE